MRFPHPMVERKFNNDYDIIVCAFSLFLWQFQKENNYFAAQCIWWVGSIIQYTEILRFHLKYNIFPSDYIRNCTVSLLPSQIHKETIVPESETSISDLNHNSDIEEESLQSEFRSTPQFNKQKQLYTMRSGWVFKNKPKYQDPTIIEVEQRFGKQSKMQRRCTRDCLRAEYKDTWDYYWWRLRKRRNIADSIWTPDLSRN